MAFEHRDNSGTLFRNEKREKESHPNAKGKVMVAGAWYWISAWTKEKEGEKFQSLAFERMKDEQAAKYGGHKDGGSTAARDPFAPDVPGYSEVPPRKAAKVDDGIPF